jgi:hypothetical protein
MPSSTPASRVTYLGFHVLGTTPHLIIQSVITRHPFRSDPDITCPDQTSSLRSRPPPHGAKAGDVHSRTLSLDPDRTPSQAHSKSPNCCTYLRPPTTSPPHHRPITRRSNDPHNPRTPASPPVLPSPTPNALPPLSHQSINHIPRKSHGVTIHAYISHPPCSLPSTPPPPPTDPPTRGWPARRGARQCLTPSPLRLTNGQ